MKLVDTKYKDAKTVDDLGLAELGDKVWEDYLGGKADSIFSFHAGGVLYLIFKSPDEIYIGPWLTRYLIIREEEDGETSVSLAWKGVVMGW